MWGYKRNNCMIKPGVYALGNPKPTSPILVTCNYKFTFDILRKDLKGLDCWLLILETNRVNGWCAPGKGTFGTNELIGMIKRTKLEFNKEKCIGCGICNTACPYNVFTIKEKKAIIVDKDKCIECGACMNNCEPGEISVTQGVG